MPISFKTPEEIERHIAYSNMFAHRATIDWGHSSYKTDYLNISELFLNLATNTLLLKELEKRFTQFIKTYYPGKINIGTPPDFRAWYYNEDYGLPAALPIPSEKNFTSQTLKENLLRKPEWKGKGALILFFYEQLMELGILTPGKTIDEQIFYCIGIVPAAHIEGQMNQKKLFVDIGPVCIAVHSKYAHLLQLLLIGLATKLDTDKKLNLTFKLEELVKALLSPNDKLTYIDPTTYTRSQKNGWDYCLDLAKSGTTNGAAGLNVIMLSPIAKKHCTIFYQYWSWSYVKKLEEQRFYDAKNDGLTLDETIQSMVEDPNIIYVKFLDQYMEDYKKNNTLINLGDNMYQKQRAGLEKYTQFNEISEKIRKKSLRSKFISFEVSDERSPLIPSLARSQPSRPSLFSCFKWKK